MPPLKRFMASPILQIACPGKGYYEILGLVRMGEMFTDLNVLPRFSSRNEDLQPSEPVV